MARGRILFLALLVFRLIITFQLRTFFQPDEFYQSLEPAHNLVFGYGYLTWEYIHAVRSIAHPLLFAIPYKLLKMVSLDSSTAISAVPKVIGSIQAAAGDYFTVLFIHKYWNNTGSWATLVTIFSAWNAFMASRTFSNSLETALTAYALYAWPFDKVKPLVNDELFYGYLETTIKSLSAIGFAFLTRPTTLLLWIFPSLRQLWLHKTAFLFEAVFIGYVAVQYSVILDSFYYGSISLPLLEFLRFNGSGSASFYGTNSLHYYFSQGLPFLLAGYTPFAIHGMFTSSIMRKEFLAMSLSNIAIYSLLGHKEVRFIMPLLPILHGYVAASFSALHSSKKMLARVCIGTVLALNACLAFYATRRHQRGVMDLVQFLSSHDEITELTLFMPCHSTPWSANIHRPHNFRFLTCEPPLGLTASESKAYRDEADQFYDDPAGFLENDWRKNGSPEFVATFQASTSALETFWSSHKISYQIEKQWFNSDLHDDPRRAGDILLYRLHPTSERDQLSLEEQRNQYQAYA